MPIKWSAEQDQKFLMLIIDTVKVDYTSISNEWEKRYPGEDKPTPKALTEHVSKLKRTSKAASGGQGLSTPPSKKAGISKTTPGSKRVTQKTPTSSVRRGKITSMSDEDDSEDEKKLDFSAPASKRESASRRSKTNKSYAESEEEDDDGLDMPRSATQPKKNTIIGKESARNSPSDSILDTNGDLANHGPIARSKKSPLKYNHFSKLGEDDSDSEDFKPL
ncbi:uncharacterized protein MYCFIDRAFT_87100 [Pseudocercospora fijiensis CIRAD86]|uniref:Uncharacterized protein n=1 Tax=Pseudocercospora fijiensis (strain CIRAD86) TaxID=383855 RepID=M2ZRS9_PSEFD|nr:uncharacterized protein MYCFIDRAFT_87100 [Pseudocercospora fijiensis CIRAD86]EME81739.1 hypothetical protein MYCFIDRAFT_87100 [Pseudocercospora fijiensis CIRAD86]